MYIQKLIIFKDSGKKFIAKAVKAHAVIRGSRGNRIFAYQQEPMILYNMHLLLSDDRRNTRLAEAGRKTTWQIMKGRRAEPMNVCADDIGQPDPCSPIPKKHHGQKEKQFSAFTLRHIRTKYEGHRAIRTERTAETGSPHTCPPTMTPAEYEPVPWASQRRLTRTTNGSHTRSEGHTCRDGREGRRGEADGIFLLCGCANVFQNAAGKLGAAFQYDLKRPDPELSISL